MTASGMVSQVQFDGGGDQDGKDNNDELIDSPRSPSLTRELASQQRDMSSNLAEQICCQ